MFVHRYIQATLEAALSQGKSILLLGPRQTGKTTLVERQLSADMEYTLLEATTRQLFESDPDALIREIKAFVQMHPDKKQPTVLIDEVQKVPQLMDTIQYVIDKQLALFIITGSSARKLKRNQASINLLPGRVIELRMDGLNLMEIPDNNLDINALLLNGSLPEIILQKDSQHKEALLSSYVNIYLEEEIRAEALVRNLASLARFLTYAAVDAGKPTNISNLSQEIGVGRHIIDEYYQILEDCLVADRIEPITNSNSRRRLAKAPKYLFFDLGVRRIAAGEGLGLPEKYLGELFEQFIGIEILKLIRLFAKQAKLRYFRDHNGPEVDFVIEYNRQYLPIEVKWTTNPLPKDAKHLCTFMKEYGCMKPAYVVCQIPRPAELAPHVLAINWKDLPKVMQEILP